MFSEPLFFFSILFSVIQSILSLIVFIRSVPLCRFWDASSSKFNQIQREKTAFQLESSIQFICILEFLHSGLFLYTGNEVLPPLLEGAMCAQGVFSSQEFGYPLLWTKIVTLLLTISLWVLLRCHKQLKVQPLFPFVFYVSPILAGLSFTELTLWFLFVSGIDIDILTQCCTSAFLKGEILYSQEVLSTPFLLGIWIFSLLCWSALRYFKSLPSLTLLFFVICWVCSILLLKAEGVKYIYGSPVHTCLFDLFIVDHLYVGYALLAGFLSLWIHQVQEFIFYQLKNHGFNCSFPSSYILFFGVFIGWGIPFLYFLKWPGIL